MYRTENHKRYASLPDFKEQYLIESLRIDPLCDKEFRWWKKKSNKWNKKLENDEFAIATDLVSQEMFQFFWIKHSAISTHGIFHILDNVRCNHFCKLIPKTINNISGWAMKELLVINQRHLETLWKIDRNCVKMLPWQPTGTCLMMTATGLLLRGNYWFTHDWIFIFQAPLQSKAFWESTITASNALGQSTNQQN